MKKFKEYLKEAEFPFSYEDTNPKNDHVVLSPHKNAEIMNILDIAIKEEIGSRLSQEKIDCLKERIIKALDEYIKK